MLVNFGAAPLALAVLAISTAIAVIGYQLATRGNPRHQSLTPPGVPLTRRRLRARCIGYAIVLGFIGYGALRFSQVLA